MSGRVDFEEIFAKNVTRPGASELLEYIKGTDFFTAPASTKYHGAHEGGLLTHSITVYQRLIKICEPKELERKMETITIVALLHDLCKANFYSSTERAVTRENGGWSKQFYKIDDQLPLGHGEKSVFMVMQFMQLTIEEAMCIRWHMGGFDDASKGGSYAMSNAWERYPLAVKLHIADLLATYCDEKRN